MAGGKKKSATQKSRGKYSKYASGVRERNKASRIVKNLMKAEKPGVAAGKVLEKYAEVCEHANKSNVISNVTKALNKRGVEIVKPEPKEQ